MPGAGLLLHHHPVVLLDGGAGRHPGHQRLAAPGIPGEIVVLDVAQTYAPVRLGHHPGDIHRGATAGAAKADAILRVAVHAAYPAHGLGSGQTGHLLGRMLSVAAQGEHQGHVLVPYPRRFQLVQQGAHYLPGGHGAGHVAADDGDLFPGPQHVPQPGCADGFFQGPAHFRLPGEAQLHLVGGQHPQQVVLGHLYPLYTLAKAKFQHHGRSPPKGKTWAAWRSALTTGSSSPVRKRISAPPPVHR